MTDGSGSGNVWSEEMISCAHIYGLVRSCILNFCVCILVCVRMFSYKYMRVRNVYVNTYPNVDIYVLDRFTTSNIFSHFPPSFLHSLCSIKKSPKLCSLTDVHMNNCSIVIFAFCCLFTVIFLLYNKSFI